MRLKLMARVVVGCALMFCSNVWAWNGTGHEAVAAIAWDNLTPAAKAKVTELLKQHPDYKRTLMKETTQAGEERDREAFMVAATWPDLIRSPSFGKSHELAHSNWHFIDLPYVIGNVKAPTDISMKWPEEGQKEPTNAIQAIKKNAVDLRNTSLTPAERAVALCWIEHLVGDIHQPLHATSLYSAQYPEGDRGGNSMIVRTPPDGNGGSGRTSNLHSFWDGLIGGYMEIGEVEKISAKYEKDHPRKEFEKELGVRDVDQWALGSLEEAKRVVYGDGKLPGVPRTKGESASQPALVPLSAEYLQKAHALAERNVTLAGYRLADALNGMFGGQ
ncbi:MAG: S1/P1 nuclease [Phycisphaerae bacterium]